MTEQSWPAVPTGDPPVYPDGGVELNIGRHRIMFADRTGVVGAPGSTDRSVFADSSGLVVKRRAGARWVQGIYGTDDEEKSLTVATPHASLWRVDRVVDRLSSDGVIKTHVLTGTAATEPVAPSLTQTAGGTWEESLATFRVKPAAVSVTASDAAVQDERRFMPVTVTPVSSEALRPAAPLVGDEVDFPDGRRQRWTGAAWSGEVSASRFATLSGSAQVEANGAIVTTNLFQGPRAIVDRFETPGGSFLATVDGKVHGTVLRAPKVQIASGGGTNTDVPTIAADSDTTMTFANEGASLWLTLKAAAFAVQSSRRFKEKIRATRYGLADLLALQPVDYHYKATPDVPQTGLIAEEVAGIYPEAVTFDADGQPEAIDYSKLVPLLIRAVQELEERVRQLERPE